MNLSLQRYAGCVLLAALLFGASTPLAKHLLGNVSPLILAGLFYLGMGFGLLAIRLARKAFNGEQSARSLHGKDYGWLLIAILTGGICAPILLLWGLSGTSASASSLLLNFEGILTTILASLIFRETVGRRIWLATILMLSAGSVLAYAPDAEIRDFVRAAAVIGACLFWALDNNVTRNISAADAVSIAMYKGLVAGCVNLGLGWLAGAKLPAMEIAIQATLIGLFSYGLSLVLFIIALRHLGTARTSAHFSTAPFFGAALSIILLNEPLTTNFAAGVALMLFATWLILTEQHEHVHRHDALAHAHMHRHDAHHQHGHEGHEGPEPHNHVHVHEPLLHSHPHLPDLHHRHRH